MGNRVELCNSQNCTQCHACESECPRNCISFVEAKDGFLIPIINRDLCIECGRCMSVCHQFNNPKLLRLGKPKSYAAWNKDDKIRAKSSSGGVFSVLSEKIIQGGGVVFGSVMDDKFQVHHTYATCKEDLVLMRGSKYVQSDLTGVYIKVKDYLKKGRTILFTGTPCQVAGLYCYLKKDYANLYTCDLICHGVPSQKAFDIYCYKIAIKKRNACEIGFRNLKGWGLQMAYKSQLISSLEDCDNKWVDLSPLNSYYLRAFSKGLMFNEACYSCKYTQVNRLSDFTLADYWGIGAMTPFNYPKRKGVSLFLVNSDKANSFVSGIDDLFLIERTLEEAIKGNRNLTHSSERPIGRDSYYEDSLNMNINCLMEKYKIQPSFKDYARFLRRKILG